MSLQIIPLHPVQRDIFLDQAINPLRPNYNVVAFMTISGDLDLPVFRRVLSHAASVFDIFRMRFDINDETPVVYLTDTATMPALNVIDCSTAADPVVAARSWMQGRADHPFLLSKDNILYEHALLKISGQTYYYFFQFHHLIFDGYCWRIWAKYLTGSYRSAVESAGEIPHFETPSYIRAVEEAAVAYESLTYKAHADYWQEMIQEDPAGMLPRHYARREPQMPESGSYVYPLTAAQRDMLLQLATTLNVRLPHLTLAAVIIYLSATTGREELVLGTPAHKRKGPDQRSTMGLFTGIVPFKGQYVPQQLLTDLIRQIAAAQKADYAHVDYLIGDLARHLKHDAFSGPLLDMIVNYVLLDLDLDFGVGIQADFEVMFSQYQIEPLRMIWWDYSEKQSLELRFDFRYEYFTQEEVALLAERILFILEQFSGKLHEPVSSVAVIPSNELELLRTAGMPTAYTYPADKTVPELFRVQAAATPDATAILFEDTILTYKELDGASDQLAAYLLQSGITPETLIPVCLDRSADLIVTLLGILKAGAAFVPLDPRYPQQRIEQMLSETEYKLAITSSEYRDLFQPDVQALTLEALQPILGLMPETALPVGIQADNLAYVMYTSGSTGRPKGVMVTHQNIVSLALGSGFLDWSSADVLLSTGSPSFDASTIEYWGTLLNGATLVLCPEERLLDSAQLKEEVAERGVTRMWFTAGWLNQLVDTDISVFAGLKTVIAGGEKLSAHHIGRLRDAYPDLAIINGYGPTENTTFSLTWSIEAVTAGESIPIGRPLYNRTAYVLDSQLQLLPIGIAGELYVGGAGLSRGYLHQPELTAERFIHHPVSGERLYRTGDLARVLPDGSIAYLGRSDDQVKLRGFRIELGEIESVLQDSGCVSHGVVVLRGEGSGKQLVAYVIPEEQYDEAVLLTYLAKRLPDYMVPSFIVVLEAFPLTNNGKVDKRALPDPEAQQLQTAGYVAARNETEAAIIAIWQEALQIDRVGIYDDFFRLGGDSIRAIGVISQLRKRFSESIRLYELYQSGNVAALSVLIDNLQPSSIETDELKAIVVAEVDALRAAVLEERADAATIADVYPMSDIQSGMIYASLWQTDKSVYHDQITFRISDRPDKRILHRALTMLVQKHAILRTVFDQHPVYGGIQIVRKVANFDLNEVVWCDVSKEQEKDAIQRFMASEREKGFELNNALLWRVAILQFRQSCYLVFQFHHAMLDGWSLASLTTELNSLYVTLFAQYDLPPLQSLKATYKDFVLDGITEKRNTGNQQFWQQELQGYRRLDIFREEPVSIQLVRSFDKTTFERLQQRIQADRLSMRGFFLGVTLRVLSTLTYEDDLTIGVVTNNRPLLDDGDKVLGCFLNTVPFRQRNAKEAATWLSYFRQVEEQLVRLKERERISLFAITAATGEAANGGNPFFDVLFNFVNFHVYDHLQEGLFRQGHVAIGEEEAHMSMVHELTNTFLDFCISTTGNNLLLICKMNRQLKSGKSPEVLADYFAAVIQQYLDHADMPADSLAIYPQTEQQELASFSNPTAAIPPATTLTAVFEERVAATPEATALIFEDIRLTYRQLNEQAGKLAAWLQANGLQQTVLIPVCLDRSPEMVIAILAILKTGNAYVPLDPAYPAERIGYILKDTQASVVVSSKKHGAKLLAAGASKVLEIDTDAAVIGTYMPIAGQVAGPADTLAYVIYTSGSTGHPKGVLAEHGSVLSLINHQSSVYGISSSDRILLCANYCFDPSVEQLFFALLNGAAVVICKEETIRDPHLLECLLREQGVTHLEATPGVIEHLTPGTYNGLKRVISGGEVCRKELAEKWCGLLDFYNIYGPTETTISAIIYQCNPAQLSQVDVLPIGRPLPHVQVYILDVKGNPAPVGVPGEIYIGGAGVTRGYLNQPELTATVFLPDRFSNVPGARMYKTGDLGRWLPDGNIEYLSRLDAQLKLHGYRIEPDEIANVLLGSEWVSQAVVLDNRDDTGQVRICAYIVLAKQVEKDVLRAYLSAQLPAYMVPSVIWYLDVLPLTPNGKIDRNALKMMGVSATVSTEYVAPRSATEKQLWEIWQQLLPADRIGVLDDFFELGGHSLLAMRMNAHIKRAIGVNVPVKKLFQCRCIARLAEYLDVTSATPVQKNDKAAARIIEI
ncbi:non-ribosomal peptide synthetase [Chitinophaga rhizophila]|uniref:Amino acid adenylation domain-containing protein n=1 Tax=Chitinophaga rhizophila TaxID=2866212 RepID=A0ABS7GAH5_9BACT|nr:non-ribosomal peptide synthetase [Chitinophaga rhizophila]MBW8684664.1 amino acid adenylation domain-containing protein [Chitinophaga rhizophila]